MPSDMLSLRADLVWASYGSAILCENEQFQGLQSVVLLLCACTCGDGSIAVSMNFVNKLALQMFPLSNIIMVGQMLATWTVLRPLMAVGILTFAPFSWRRCRRLLLVTILYTANTSFALVSFKSLNIPMYNTLKRLTPMVVLVCKVAASVLLVVVGCIVAGAGDLSFDALGYMYAFLSCTMQAAYLLVVEFQAVGLVLPGCALFGMLLNYALFLCTVNNSALLTTIVGVLKGVAAIALGFFLLGGVQATPLLLLGIGMNTTGAIWYTAVDYQDRHLSRQSMRLTPPRVQPTTGKTEAGTHGEPLLQDLGSEQEVKPWELEGQPMTGPAGQATRRQPNVMV